MNVPDIVAATGHLGNLNISYLLIPPGEQGI
jgi:hypothetical protein